MKHHLKIFITFVATFFIAGLMLFTTNQNVSASIGVAPGTASNDVLLPGSEYDQVFTISRSNPESAATATIEWDSTIAEVKDWIAFDPGLRVVLPEGETQVPFRAKITVPEDAQLGTYDGIFRISLEEPGNDGQVVVVPAVRIDLTFTITNEAVSELYVRAARMENVKKGDDFEVTLKIENKGNASDSPTEAQLEILDLHEELVTTLESTSVGSVDAFAIQDVLAKFSSSSLEEGEYFGVVKVFDNGELLFQDQLYFKVLPEEILPPQDEVAAQAERGNTTLLIILLIILAVIVVIVLVYFLMKKDDEAPGESPPSSTPPMVSSLNNRPGPPSSSPPEGTGAENSSSESV